MNYPLDVEAEMDRALDKLNRVRVSGEKWAYFRGLVEQINTVYAAGLNGEEWARWDVDATLVSDSEQFGFGVDERKLVIAWMEGINKAYRAGYAASHQPIVMEEPRVVDPETGRTIKKIRSAVDLESVIYGLIRQRKAVCLQMPGGAGSAMIQPQV